MTKGTQNLFRSLVGSSIEFRFSKDTVVSVSQNIRAERERISRDVEAALSVGGSLCIMLLAELTNYYRNGPHYMAVRGAIEMHRYRPAVLDYLLLSVTERAERLYSELSKDAFNKNKDRDLKVLIAKYFLGTYPSRFSYFKGVLLPKERLFVL